MKTADFKGTSFSQFSTNRKLMCL